MNDSTKQPAGEADNQSVGAPDGSRRSADIPDGSRRSANLPDGSRRSADIPDGSRRSAKTVVFLGRIAKSILRTGLVMYVLIVILMVIFESRLVYPGAYMQWPSSDVAGVSEVKYQSADGTKLVGRLFHHPNLDNDQPQRTVLFFHGNGITAEAESAFIASLGRTLGANVMAAEYRGFGSLEGSPSEVGVIADSMAARDFICEHYSIKPNELILYGQSLGGGCAVAVAADNGAKLLVLDRTFDRMVDVAAQRYWFIPVKWLMRNRYDSIQRIENYSGPLLQIHGPPDKMVPMQNGRRLYEASTSQRKRWIEVPNMRHNDPMPNTVWNEVLGQIKIWTPSPLPASLRSQPVNQDGGGDGGV